MRRILAGDMSALARVLYGLPDAQWPARLASVLAAAEMADAYRIRTGCAHPGWGTGSIAAATHGMRKPPEPDFDDDRYCRCWLAAVQAVIDHRAGNRRAREHHAGASRGQPAAQEMQSGTVGSCDRRPSAISSPQSRQSP